MSHNLTKADFQALLRAFFDPPTMTKEEADAAKVAMDKMSPWQSMSFDDLAKLLKEEEQAHDMRTAKCR